MNSSGSNEVSEFLELQLAQIMQSHSATFIINICDTQTQHKGVNECGTLAIAFAVDYLQTKMLRKQKFNISKLRKHLMQCLYEQKISEFPKVGTNGPPMKIKVKEAVKVYCKCRMPEQFDNQMVYCNKCHVWFHFTCENLVEEPNKRHWVCSSCQKK